MPQHGAEPPLPPAAGTACAAALRFVCSHHHNDGFPLGFSSRDYKGKCNTCEPEPTLANFSVLVFYPNFVVDGGCCCCVVVVIVVVVVVVGSVLLWLWVWTPPDRLPPDRPPPDRPKFRSFFPLSIFVLFLSLWGSSRGILVVFVKTGTLKCARLEFSGCCVKPRWVRGQLISSGPHPSGPCPSGPHPSGPHPSEPPSGQVWPKSVK